MIRAIIRVLDGWIDENGSDPPFFIYVLIVKLYTDDWPELGSRQYENTNGENPFYFS